MILTPENLVHFLLERGLLTSDSVVHRGVEIAEVSRRNRNFRITQHDGQGYFVKQVRHWEPEALRTLQTEAECYRLAARDASFSGIAEIVPRFCLFDARRSILITELLDDAETITEHHFRNPDFPIEVAAQLGQAFGTYHASAVAHPHHDGNGLFPHRPPWVLSLHEVQPHMVPHVSAGIHQMIAMVRRFPQFATALDALRSEWSPHGLIHGDIKWDNCILGPASNGHHRLKIVDWELADWGDPCWDVAGIISAYLSFWVQSLPMESIATPGVMVDGARYPLDRMQPAIRAFWNEYARCRGAGVQEERRLLRRVMMYTAARIIQTAFEVLQTSPAANSATVLFLQLSMNVLADPEEAIHELLGIEQ